MRILYLIFILSQSLAANSIPIFGIVKDSLLNQTLEGVNILSGNDCHSMSSMMTWSDKVKHIAW